MQVLTPPILYSVLKVYRFTKSISSAFLNAINLLSGENLILV